MWICTVAVSTSGTCQWLSLCKAVTCLKQPAPTSVFPCFIQGILPHDAESVYTTILESLVEGGEIMYLLKVRLLEYTELVHSIYWSIHTKLVHFIFQAFEDLRPLFIAMYRFVNCYNVILLDVRTAARCGITYTAGKLPCSSHV